MVGHNTGDETAEQRGDESREIKETEREGDPISKVDDEEDESDEGDAVADQRDGARNCIETEVPPQPRIHLASFLTHCSTLSGSCGLYVMQSLDCVTYLL